MFLEHVERYAKKFERITMIPLGVVSSAILLAAALFKIQLLITLPFLAILVGMAFSSSLREYLWSYRKLQKLFGDKTNRKIYKALLNEKTKEELRWAEIEDLRNRTRLRRLKEH